MGEQKLWYLVAYDIRDDRRLQRAAKRLKGYGSRIQYSVFGCRLSDRQLEKMRWELEKELEKDDDLLIVGLCASCADRVRKKQKDAGWFEKPVSFEIV
jgi:CRISPR-associated protein Cas2